MNTKLCSPCPQRFPRNRTRGSALYLVLILGAVAAAIMAGTFAYINQTAKIEKRSNLRLESTYAAEYAFEKAYQELKGVIGQYNLPTLGNTSAVTNLTTAPTSAFPSGQGYTWNAYLTVPIENGVPVWDFSSDLKISQGPYSYLTVVEITRSMPTGGAPVHEQFQRNWTYVIKPLFQYAIFSDGDLELFPGAAFKVTGRVHANGKIYSGSTASITYGDNVSQIGGYAAHYSPLDPRSEPGNLNSPSYTKGSPLTTTRENPPGTLVKDDSDSNDNNDGSRELIEIPDRMNSDPNATDRLYNKAGLKVLVNTTGSATISTSGVTVPANARVFVTEDGTAVPTGDPLATYLSTMLSTGSMKDYREGATLTTTDVDVGKLATGYKDGGLPSTIPNGTTWPSNSTVPSDLQGKSIPEALRGKSLWNGVLYVADITNSNSHRTGVRLVNGSDLSSLPASGAGSGLTVATENPAYIVGDYNSTSSKWRPSAVIADAVTVVSSNWNNANTSLSSRTPLNTTINTAIIAGNVSTSSTAYSGGMENFIRLLENWSGKTLTYNGSLVNLFQSKQATAPWQSTGNYYNAPVRTWKFDPNFNDPNKLPPGAPVARSLKRGQWAQID